MTGQYGGVLRTTAERAAGGQRSPKLSGTPHDHLRETGYSGCFPGGPSGYRKVESKTAAGTIGALPLASESFPCLGRS